MLEDMYFPDLVIEKVPEGDSVMTTEQEWWYHWEGPERGGKYVPWEKPKEYQGVVNFWG